MMIALLPPEDPEPDACNETFTAYGWAVSIIFIIMGLVMPIGMDVGETSYLCS